MLINKECKLYIIYKKSIAYKAYMCLQITKLQKITNIIFVFL